MEVRPPLHFGLDSSSDLPLAYRLYHPEEEMEMHIATVTLTSTSAYSQSRMHRTPMLEKEAHDAYEERVWREK